MQIPKPTKGERIFSTIMAFMVLIFLFFITFRVMNEDTFYNEMLCDWEKEFFDKKINAIVASKYLDAQNHNFPTVVLLRKKYEEKLDLTSEKSKLYLRLDPGDSLIKKKGQLEYEIVRKNKRIKGTISFGCDYNMRQQSLLRITDNKAFTILFILFIIAVPILILYLNLKQLP